MCMRPLAPLTPFSMGDVFSKNPKKKTHKATDALVHVMSKRLKPSSVVAVAPTWLASVSMASLNVSGS